MSPSGLVKPNSTLEVRMPDLADHCQLGVLKVGETYLMAGNYFPEEVHETAYFSLCGNCGNYTRIDSVDDKMFDFVRNSYNWATGQCATGSPSQW